jgi:pimeloyl-ACP methyl ester carboxylesterase
MGSPVAEQLARDFEVVLFNRRGRGASEPGGGPHERQVADVRALIHQTGAATALVGHSFGGAVAIEAALVDPRISSIVVYEPAIGVGGSISEANIDRMDELLARGEPDAAIARLDAAGLVSADARTSGTRRPESVLALAPTVPRELRASRLQGRQSSDSDRSSPGP